MPETPELIVVTHNRMMRFLNSAAGKQMAYENAAMHWVQRWLSQTPDEVWQPIVQAEMDRLMRRGLDPEYGKICVRVWNRCRNKFKLKDKEATMGLSPFDRGKEARQTRKAHLMNSTPKDRSKAKTPKQRPGFKKKRKRK